MPKDHQFIPNRYTSFLQKVDVSGFDPNACWTFRGASKGNGYGHVTVEREQVTAHRRSYELFCGPVPDGLDVCQTCDNRNCVNPDHLFVGTRQQNMDDCKAKGRTAGGNRKHLTEAAVQEVRRRFGQGHHPRRIAVQMDINYGTVSAILSGRSYVGIGQ